MRNPPRSSRITAWGLLIIFVLTSDASGAEDHGDAVRMERGVRQLFLDDAKILHVDGLQRVVNPPRRHPDNPLIVPDEPWERACSIYGTAMYDEAMNRFRLWYLISPADRDLQPISMDGYERPPHSTLVGYAESDDGITWNKPNLGQFPYDGSRKNNLIDIGKYNVEGVSVLFDPRDPEPSRRWKALFWDHGSGGWELVDGGPRTIDGPLDGIWVAFSPDGIHWTNYENNPVIAGYSDTNQCVVYDPKIDRYVAFGRFGFGRRLARSESKDFIHWSPPQLVLECDAADGTATQIYGSGTVLYEGVYLSMLWIYREGIDGTIDTQLATSRDGIRWTRVGDRATWLSLGPEDSWEGGMARSAERIIVRGDELWIYYVGVHGAHVGPKFKTVERKHKPSIGLLTTRRDGFVSFDAGQEPGSLVTRPFKLPAGRLHLNADATDGQVRAAILDLDGHTLVQSDFLTGDHPDTAVPFDHHVRPGTPVCLKLTARKAKLYSFWWR